MTNWPWLPHFMVALTSAVLIIQLTRLYYSRRFGNPMPSYWRGSIIQFTGMLFFYVRPLLPEAWANMLMLIGMPLMALGGVITLVEWRQEKKLSSEPEPPQPNEPERIPLR
jgi:TRAP-type C4-dicarboxylate transport system permease small subunit